ncbi:cation/multidrug efflux pump [Pseudomaricurvus alkylphenolicus]|jgi:hypothetical protein|uniref:cation/multidrug efflux pump n=1 Tax=Pseudomaricurvus alkylphenolicus TaxID=1306991 RepID=UPI0014223E69|nr:cation/multidrug efflux pump [Pseudomaricurvus alkylphenolicus]NIB43882.1 cation/multidrug efflux pump [Pseudomaricurvus alkylphenolicus]
MLYDGLVIAIAAIGVIALLWAVKTLFKPGWLLGWLKGTFGLMLLLWALVMAFMAWDIVSYKELLAEKTIATINFRKLGDQHYRAVLVSGGGQEEAYELRGDQWQLDARIFKWSKAMAKLGFKPTYRLDRLAGRYYSLDKERSSDRTVYSLSESLTSVDVWEWFNYFDKNVPWLDAQYGSATFVPMTDGALYEIRLSHTGLLSRPLNQAAKDAVNHWQ